MTPGSTRVLLSLFAAAALAAPGLAEPGPAASAPPSVDACASLPAPERKPCAEVQRARQMAATGDKPGAAELVGKVSAGLPTAQAVLHVLAAELKGDAELLMRVGTAEDEAIPGLRRRALASVVELATSRKDWVLVERATSALFPLPDVSSDERTTGRIARAIALDHLGRSAEAVALAAQVLVADPAHAHVSVLEDWLDARRVALTEEQKNRRIDALLSTARLDRALVELEGSERRRDPTDDVLVERQVLLVTALVRAGHLEKGKKLAAELATEEDAPDAWRKVYAWALGKAHDEMAAADVWAALARSTKDPALAQEACFFSGFMPYEVQRYEDARVRLAACEAQLADSGWAPNALWYRALTFLVEARWTDAVPLLERLVKEHATHDEVDKHTYWLARALLATDGHDQRARRLLEQLSVARHTWYGLLAASRLGKKPARGTKVAPDAFSRRAASDDDAARARLLWALGFVEEAHALARARGNETEDLALSAALGDVHRPWRWGARYKPRAPVKRDRLVGSSGWRASYPTPWDDVVRAAAQERGLDPALAWAIMRQESGFLPRAESKVGARGVMQLMPYTAAGVAPLAGLRSPPPVELFRPAVCIPLGVAWLATGQRELGNVMLAVAAYNGGPENVAPWMTAFGQLDAELFVERIPFKETRNYVKVVLPARALYRALEGEPLTLDLPVGPIGPPPAHVTAFRPRQPD